MKNLKSLISKIITHTPIQYFPIRVRKGLAKGARWTLAPWAHYWRGNIEKDVERAVCLYGASAGATCWDLGAHFGIYTVGMAMAVGPRGEVVGIEPDPASFKRCKLHVRMNSLSWVKLFNAAASDFEGSSTLILSHGPGATTSHFAYEGEDPGRSPLKVEMPTIMLDRLVEQGKIRFPQFIKVDVEGHGARALKGACETIAAYRPTIVMAFHSKRELTGTREMLKPLGYRCFSCDGKKIDWPTGINRNVVFRCL